MNEQVKILQDQGVPDDVISTIAGVPVENLTGELEQDATDRLREFASKLKTSPLYGIDGVEIFRAGVWNGDKYTEKDLEDIVAAFDSVGYNVPVKLGHKENSGDPAYGWIRKIQKVGDKIVADIQDLPETIYKAIRERKFDSVSSEIYWNLRRGEKTFRRALKAVALLGAEIPGVAGLKPLRESFTNELPEGVTFSYNLNHEDLDMDLEQLKSELAAANAKIAELTEKVGNAPDDGQVKALQDANQAMEKKIAELTAERLDREVQKVVESCTVPAYQPIVNALYRQVSGIDTVDKTYKIGDGPNWGDMSGADLVKGLIDRINADYSKLFENLSDDSRRNMGYETGTESADKTIDRMVSDLQKTDKSLDYGAAMSIVLRDNPDLARRYNQE